MCEDSHELMLWMPAKNTTATIILTLYGHPCPVGTSSTPFNFAVFCLAFRPGAVGIAAMSPGRQDDGF